MKKKYLTEFEEIQEALKRVRMDENVMPYHNGRLVEAEDTYNKIQKLLDCPQMAESHRFLYDLDVEDLEESEIDKVDALFDLGVKKGFIDNSFEQELADDAGGDAAEEIEDEPGECCGEPGCSCGGNKAPVPCWTILYSATKNGEVKTGECYSNAISVSAAKADCLAKLSRFGYENVSVLAIEAGDPDACCGECNEDDLLRDRPHNAHVAVNEEGEEDVDEDDESIEEGAKNPYIAGMKVVTGNVPKAKPACGKKTKKVDEDDEGGDDDSGSDDSGSDDSGSDDTDSGSDDEGSDDTDSGSDDEGSDDSGFDDAGSDDEGGDDSGSDDSGSDDTDSDDEGDDDSSSEDAGSDEGDDDTDSGDEGDDDSGDDDSGDEGDDDSGDEGDEDSGSDDGGDDEGDDELDDEQKAALKNEYSTAFKDTMLACEFEDKCFNDLTIDEKVKFFGKLAEKWTKADPKKFMSDKEQDQLDAIVATR